MIQKSNSPVNILQKHFLVDLNNDGNSIYYFRGLVTYYKEIKQH